MVNAFLSSLLTQKYKDQSTLERMEKKLFFSPEKNNVVFASAIHCWGFTVSIFGEFLKSKKLITDDKYLWGEYYEHPKTKEISSKPYNSKDICLFTKHILRTLWQVAL